jgi:hypothetical protein
VANRGKKLALSSDYGIGHGLHPLERAGIISRS